eukprot:TRINITY_DN10017_c0_g1_i1.p1 TRINITY_DN10017_c0_g1~~TRINITY_DN10017_c0_g1_i1.p1  ORF type:complete len:167 (-),score=15.56 TRINITY_DN10017_c0_g1_i1:99-599(-)
MSGLYVLASMVPAAGLGIVLGSTVHGLDLSPLKDMFGPYAEPVMVVGIGAIIVMFAALCANRSEPRIIASAVVVAGTCGYVLGALAGDIGFKTTIACLGASVIVGLLIAAPACFSPDRMCAARDYDEMTPAAEFEVENPSKMPRPSRMDDTISESEQRMLRRLDNV